MADALESEKKKLNISIILNIITIIGFLITVGTFVYSSGKKDARLEQLEKDNISNKTEISTIKTQLNEQNTATKEVNAKLDLLLNHFNITNPNH